MNEAKERYQRLMQIAADAEKSGNPDYAAGNTYWRNWDSVTRAALTEHGFGDNSKVENLQSVLNTTDPELRAAIREAYSNYDQAIRSAAAKIVRRRAAELLGALEKEAEELAELIRSLKDAP